MTRPKNPAAVSSQILPELPLDPEHWRAIFHSLQLSPQQEKVVELVLRGLGDKQIAAIMGIGEPTIRTYLDRIWERTKAHGRMELAMRILAVSHEVAQKGSVSAKAMTHI